MHFDTTLRTPPAHTHTGCGRTDKEKLRGDLANFDPDTLLEKLRWAREEMQRNFQQPMSARTMRLCTVCSERWDTAEDGGGDYRWVVYHVSRETAQQQSAFNLEAGPAIGNEALAGTRRSVFFWGGM